MRIEWIVFNTKDNVELLQCLHNANDHKENIFSLKIVVPTINRLNTRQRPLLNVLRKNFLGYTKFNAISTELQQSSSKGLNQSQYTIPKELNLYKVAYHQIQCL